MLPARRGSESATEKMAARDAVLTNPDIARQIISRAARPVGLLSSSKSIRTSDECASLFEVWDREGCPEGTSNLSPLQTTCLASMGGRESEFCEGVFNMTDGGSPARSSVRATVVANRVGSLLHDTAVSGKTVIVEFVFGVYAITLQRSSDDGQLLVVTEGGWRRRGSPCRPSIDETTNLINQLLRSTGRVQLPCPAGSAVPPGYLHVPRAMRVRVSEANRGMGARVETLRLIALRH